MSRTLSEIFRHKRANGYKTGGLTPFGYTVDEDGKLLEDPDEQEAIALMHEWRRGGYTLRAIATKLKRHGIITRKGRTTWQISVISDILNRRKEKLPYKWKIKPKKLRAMLFLGDQCYVCGYRDESGISMDFHHLDETIKSNARAGLMGATGAQFEKELKNCILLCSNCHRKLHAGIIEIKNKERTMEETKEVETKKRITYGDVHICLSCEHMDYCRFAACVEGVHYTMNRGGDYEVGVPEEGALSKSELAKLEIVALEDVPSYVEKTILAGIRVCPRHSSGDPRLTEGIIE